MVPMGAELGRLATEPLPAVRSSTSERSGSLTLSTPRSPSSTPTYLLVYEAILPFKLRNRLHREGGTFSGRQRQGRVRSL